MKLAALDVDGTLYDGTLGFALLDELRAGGLVSSSAVRHVRDTMREHRRSGGRFRDTTGPASDAYARAVEGVLPRDAVLASCRVWPRVRHRLLACAVPLVESLRGAGFTPVLLSGSPQEMIDRVATDLGIGHRFGMRLATGPGGRWTRRFTSLPAVPEAKARLLCALAEGLGADLACAVAVGNSASDRAMLAAVGHPVAFEPDEALLAVARDSGWSITDRHTLVPLLSTPAFQSSPASRRAPAASPLRTHSERNLHAHTS